MYLFCFFLITYFYLTSYNNSKKFSKKVYNRKNMFLTTSKKSSRAIIYSLIASIIQRIIKASTKIITLNAYIYGYIDAQQECCISFFYKRKKCNNGNLCIPNY